MPLNTLYQLRMKQEWGTGGKPLESVYFFDHTAGSGDWADLAAAFGASYVPAVNDLQATVVKNASLDVINLGEPTDFGFLPVVGAGTFVGEVLPPFNAISYTLKVNTRAVAKGSKRISGIPEAVQNFGVISDAGYLADMEVLRLILSQELVDGGNTWLPVIVKRIKESIVGTVPPQFTYRLPTTGDTLTLGEVVAVLTTANIKHQVSREV